MNEQLEHDWTLTQSFFVGMGGIAIKFENDDEAFPLYGWQVTKLRRDSFRPILQDRLTGMVLLGNEPFLHRLDPHILTKEEIEDKIKANILVKALTVTQASWIVGRSELNLPKDFTETWSYSPDKCSGSAKSPNLATGIGYLRLRLLHCNHVLFLVA